MIKKVIFIFGERWPDTGLHSHWGHLSISAIYKHDEVRTNVDIYSLLWELQDKVDWCNFE